MSYVPEVIADNSGQWCGNGLRFATKKEAEEYAHDLSMRWFAVKDTRASESDDPVSHTYHDRELRQVGPSPQDP